jgi:hypothetical protein
VAVPVSGREPPPDHQVTRDVPLAQVSSRLRNGAGRDAPGRRARFPEARETDSLVGAIACAGPGRARTDLAVPRAVHQIRPTCRTLIDPFSAPVPTGDPLPTVRIRDRHDSGDMFAGRRGAVDRRHRIGRHRLRVRGSPDEHAEPNRWGLERCDGGLGWRRTRQCWEQCQFQLQYAPGD